MRLERDLSREDRRVVCVRLVRPPLPLLARELVAALLAQHDGERDERPALGADLHERPRLAVRPSRLAHLHGVYRPEPLHVLPVVEDEAFRLARLGREAEAASDHLDVQARARRGAQERDGVEAADVRPRRHHRHVAAVLQGRQRSAEEVDGDRLALESAYDLVPLLGRRVARHDGALLSGVRGDELRHLVAMLHRRAEDEAGLAVFRLLHDLAACRGDEAVFAHRLLHVLRHELAGADVQVVEVGVGDARLRRDLRQPSRVDQVLDVRLVAHLVEEVFGAADESALRPERRGRPSDHADVRVLRLGGVEERLVASLAVRRHHVDFVDHDEVERLEEVDLVVD